MSDRPERNGSHGKGAGMHADDHLDSSSSNGTQAGVRGIEAISQTWTTWSLAMAYVGIFLVACSYSLEGQTTVNLTAYATSAFSEHSLISTVYVVQGVVNAAVKPPMAKIANVFGRLEAFYISILLYVLGYVQMAASENIQTFASAQIFYSSGFTGLLILQQIFIADTSDLTWRALLSALPDTPFLWTVWVGPLIAQGLVVQWRWGYGLWAIVLPLCFLPLALSLIVNARKAKKQGILPPRPWQGMSLPQGLKSLWFELDIMGLLLLSAAIALILIPLTLAATAKGGYHNASIIAMLVVGAICFVLFPLWESSERLAPYPFMPLRVLSERDVAIGCVTGFFYFAAFYTSVYPYFNSYLQVVQGTSVVAAGHITQTFSFTSTVAAVVTGILIKYTKVYKPFICVGAAVYLLGIGLMVRYRQEGSSVAQNVGVQIAVGIGGGMFNVPMQIAVQAAVPHQDVAAATAIYLTVIEIGGAVGAAISGALWTGTLPGKLETYLPEADKARALSIYGNLTLATSFPEGSPQRIAINRSYQETMDRILIASLCLAAPVFLCSLLLRSRSLDAVGQKVKGNVIGSSSNSGGGDKADGSRTADTGRGGFMRRWRK